MAFEYDTGEVQVVILGGVNKQTGKKNPTELTGYYLRKGTIDTKFGTKPLYTFRTADGDKALIGSGNLNKLMESKQVGLLTHIIDTGTVKDVGKGNPMKVFKVGQDRADSLDEGLNQGSMPKNFSEDNASDEEIYEDDDLQPVAAVARPSAPASRPAVNADSQAKVQALLSRARSR